MPASGSCGDHRDDAPPQRQRRRAWFPAEAPNDSVGGEEKNRSRRERLRRRPSTAAAAAIVDDDDEYPPLRRRRQERQRERLEGVQEGDQPNAAERFRTSPQSRGKLCALQVVAVVALIHRGAAPWSPASSAGFKSKAWSTHSSFVFVLMHPNIMLHAAAAAAHSRLTSLR